MSTPAPVERCAACNEPLGKDRNGQLAYWSVMTAGPSGWPISVKICLDCKHKADHPEPPAPAIVPLHELDLEYVYPPGATGL